MEMLHRLLFLPPQASTFAQRVDTLHYVVLVTTLLVSTAVGVTALIFYVRYRRRASRQWTAAIAPPAWVEFLFVIIPMAVFLAFFHRGFRDFVWLQAPPADAMDVYVMGKQWMWKFSYPDGPSSVRVLHVPAGRPVRLLLTSRDVIHSFYVPEFRVKQDAIPGRYTQTWFNATRPGRFNIFCTEYCGLDHSLMRGEVVVLEPADFDAWMRAQRTGIPQVADAEPQTGMPRETAMVEQGQQVALKQGCVKCHSLDGSPHLAPSFRGMYRSQVKLTDGRTVVADEGYLTASMMDPAAEVVQGFTPVMPSFRGKVEGPEVAALLEFIKSLGTGGPQPAEGPP